MRGGSWNNSASNLRSANRNNNTPDNRNDNNGFRLARSPVHSSNGRMMNDQQTESRPCLSVTRTAGRNEDAEPVLVVGWMSGRRFRQGKTLMSCSVHPQGEVIMKLTKVVLAVFLFIGAGVVFLPGGANEAQAKMSYECWTHPNGKADKMVHVSADNNAEAVSLAIEKFRSIGVSPVGVTCK
jgi:hypothetical protein